MNILRIGALAVGTALVIGLAVWVARLGPKERHTEATVPNAEPAQSLQLPRASRPVMTTSTPYTWTNSAGKVHPYPAVRLMDMDDEEKADIEKKWKERFEPALEHWCKAYEGRLPPGVELLTLANFTSVLSEKTYSFKIGDISLQILDGKTLEGKDGARVFALTIKGVNGRVGAPPIEGTVPDLSMPVTREQILMMVEADSGVRFAPDKVKLTPSAAEGSIQGGAIVTVDQVMLDGGSLESHPYFSMIFDDSGTMVSYIR